MTPEMSSEQAKEAVVNMQVKKIANDGSWFRRGGVSLGLVALDAILAQIPAVESLPPAVKGAALAAELLLTEWVVRGQIRRQSIRTQGLVEFVQQNPTNTTSANEN